MDQQNMLKIVRWPHLHQRTTPQS